MTNWTAPPRDSTLTYFSSADGGAEHRIPSQLEFEQSLVYNLLFEPNGLVVPDVFFFNSRPLLNHLAGANASLFEEALKNGLVVPCVRDPAAETLPTCFRHCAASGASRGRSPKWRNGSMS